MALDPGQQIDGLRIEAEIGRGAWGVVYLARDLLIGRRVAVKVLPRGLGEVSERAREQILNEARLIGGLNSPHVVTLYRLHSTSDGGWMQEMEYVEGGSLEDRLADAQPLPVPEAVRIFRSVCLALRAAHASRIIHGDIKPANILFGADDLVKLADFGLARILEGSSGAIALHGEPFGTPRYMAPEVLAGDTAGMGSDLWSAGVVAYRLLAGHLPFRATSFPELFAAVRNHDPPQLGSRVPPALASLVMRCLAKESGRRPASAAAAVEELDRLGRLDETLAPVVSRAQNPTNCVPATTSFVGRAREIEELAALLESAALVSLIGPGGIGKTRLARQVCEKVLDRYEGGGWFVDLSGATDAEGIARAVADTLGIPHAAEHEPARLVADALQYRPPILLVLDNFEQVLEHGALTIGLWQRRAPRARFLVTSRALLSLSGERSYELTPLPVPALVPGKPSAPEEVRRHAAVQLFVDRAGEAAPGFALDAANCADVAGICAELDGMPLAIELAAARARVMRPNEILQRLGRKFEILRSARRDLSERQRTLVGAIEWSYELLEDWEREAYLQACHFQEGFTLEAADHVIDLSGIEAAPLVLDALQGLRDKSLLRAFDTGYDTRFGMYGAIRDFGLRKSEETNGARWSRDLARRHGAHYLRFAEKWNRRIPGPRDREAFDRVAFEFGNLTAAADGARDAGDPESSARIVLAMAETMKVRRPGRLFVALLERTDGALSAGAASLRVRLKTCLSTACQLVGEWDRAVELADEAAGIARQEADRAGLCRALLQQGEMRRSRGRLDEALECFSEAERIAEETGDRHGLALGTGERGMVLGQRGQVDSALQCFRSAETIAREIGDQQTCALHVSNRGVLAEWRGRLDDAVACYREAEDLSRRIGDRLRVAVSLGNRANALVQRGDADEGLRCYQEAEAIVRELGAKQRIAQIVTSRGSVHAIRGELEEALRCYEEAERVARDLGDRRILANALGRRANVMERRGDLAGALAAFAEAERVGDAIGDRLVGALNRCHRGRLLHALGRLDEAWETTRSGITLCEEMGANHTVWYFTFQVTLASLAHARGDAEGARRLAGDALALAEALAVDGNHPDPAVRGSLSEARALSGA